MSRFNSGKFSKLFRTPDLGLVIDLSEPLRVCAFRSSDCSVDECTDSVTSFRSNVDNFEDMSETDRFGVDLRFNLEKGCHMKQRTD